MPDVADLLERIAVLERALEELRDEGLRCDLHPTSQGESTLQREEFWREYLAGADDYVRRTARAALLNLGGGSA